LFVIPGLTKLDPYLIRGNPVFLSWIPAGVYSDRNRGRNDDYQSLDENVIPVETGIQKVLFLK